MIIQDEIKLARAKKRVKTIKGFYTHLAVYIVINILITVVKASFLGAENDGNYIFWYFFAGPLFWGIGLLAHGLFVFARSIDFLKKWEDRKMKELIERDSNNINY